MPYIYSTHPNGYRVYYLYKSQKISMGLYHNYDQATLAYELCEQIFNNTLHIEDFHTNIPIAFEKFVRCVNFKKSGLYIKALWLI